MSQIFFSLEIRDINFEYDRYYLSLEDIYNKKLLLLNENKNEYKNIYNGNNELPKDAISGLTSKTIVPQFPVDQILTPILYQIFNLDFNIMNKREQNNNMKELEYKNHYKEEGNNIIQYINIDEEKEQLQNRANELTINVVSFTSKQIVCSFNVRYPLFPEYYDALGKSIDKFKILQFPCVLLQSDSGYYSLKKIVTTNKINKIIEEEIKYAIKIEPEKHLESLFTKRQKPIKPKEKKKLDFEKIMQLKGSYDSILSNINDKKQELINKKKELKSIIEERKKVLENKQKILLCHKSMEVTKISWNSMVTLKEILTKINTYITEILSIKEIKIKKCDDEIKKYKEELTNKKTKGIPNLQKINNSLIITNILLYKYALNEINYYFFNKKINIYKAFPSFYKINLTDLSLSKKMVEDFYNKNTKEISSMFGIIFFILNYISKKFDIILPYALYYNGSKSMVFTIMGNRNMTIDIYMKENEKNFLAIGKNDNDIQIKVEILSKMIYDAIMFFYSKNICSDKFIIYKNSKEIKNKNNAYFNFLKLNELFKDILHIEDNK